MKQYDPNKALISIHVPKCGGTSFRQVLNNWYQDNLYLHYPNEKENKIPTKHVLKPESCIHGHFNNKRGFGVGDYYPDADQFITILRDPWEILISLYFFRRKLKKEGGAFIKGKELKVADDINKFLEQHVMTARSYTFLSALPAGMALENFKDVIERNFVYIGVMEDFRYSVSKFAEKLGFEFVQLPHLNISPRTPYDISAELKKKFESERHLEYAIYDYVLTNYKKW